MQRKKIDASIDAASSFEEFICFCVSILQFYIRKEALKGSPWLKIKYMPSPLCVSVMGLSIASICTCSVHSDLGKQVYLRLSRKAETT